MKKQAMAATFTQVTLPEMEMFLNRAFRALHPQKSASRGEIIFDLFINPKIGIRVWSSIAEHSTSGADSGSDAIRVLFYNYAKNRPLLAGEKAPIVKRTQGWKDNLKDRIEDYLEKYEEREEYWESRV